MGKALCGAQRMQQRTRIAFLLPVTWRLLNESHDSLYIKSSRTGTWKLPEMHSSFSILPLYSQPSQLVTESDHVHFPKTSCLFPVPNLIALHSSTSSSLSCLFAHIVDSVSVWVPISLTQTPHSVSSLHTGTNSNSLARPFITFSLNTSKLAQRQCFPVVKDTDLGDRQWESTSTIHKLKSWSSYFIN